MCPTFEVLILDTDACIALWCCSHPCSSLSPCGRL